MGDFNFTRNQQAAVFANLATTGKGAARQLSAQQSQVLGAMARLAGRTGAGALQKTYRSTLAEFGGMGKVARADFGPARATSKATGILNRAELEAGVLTGRAGTTALEAQRAGAREAASGAQYALASALRYRAGQDAQLIAGQEADIAKMQLQASLDLDIYKKKLDYQQQADQKTNTNFSLIANTIPAVAADFAHLLGRNKNGDTTLTVTDPKTGVKSEVPWTRIAARDVLMQQYGIIDPNEARLFDRVTVLMEKMGMDATEAVQQAASELYGGTPGYDTGKMNELFASGVQSRSTAAITQARAATLVVPATAAQNRQQGIRRYGA